MGTQQPEWKLLWATDYNMVLTDATGVYAPEMELADEYEDDEGEPRFSLFRFDLPRLKRVAHEGRSYIVADRWDPSWPHPVHKYEEWFIKDLPDVASSMGMTTDELEEAFLSDDVSERAMAYESVGRYWGFDNLDSYPLDLSEAELEARWDDLPPRANNPAPSNKLKSKLLR